MKKRVLSLVLALVMLLGLLPTAAFAGAREDGAAMAAVEEGALLNDALSQPGEELPELPELPVIQPAEDAGLSLTLPDKGTDPAAWDADTETDAVSLSDPQTETANLTAEAPQLFSTGARAAAPFQMAVPAANQSYYYYGGDISGTIGASGANHGWSGRGRGNFNTSVSNSGDSYTLIVAEKEKYKKSNIIYQPFTLTMEVPAYSTKVVDLDLAIEGWRNSKGAASYYLELFFWGTGQDKAATTKFNVGENRYPTPGAATLTTGYRYFSDSKNGGKSTGTFSLSFSNVTAQKKTVTYNMGAYVGVNCSTSLLSSYHHTLDARFTFTAANVTQKSYAAAVNGKPYTRLSDAIDAYNATTNAYLQVFTQHITGNITLHRGGTMDLGGNAIHLYNNSTLDVRGSVGTVTQIANGTINSGGAAITHSGAGNLYLGTEDGAAVTAVNGANTGVLNTGGNLIFLEGVELLGQKENAVKNTGNSNIYFQGTPTMQSGDGKADIDLGKGLIGLRKAITNRKPYTVYLPDYNASIDPPRRVTDVWSAKMGSADPKDYFTISVPNVSPKPATLLQSLTNGGNAVVVRPLMLALRPNGGSGVPSYVTVAQGQAVGTLPTPTRKGYTFDGWFLNADRNQPVGSDTIFTADAVLTAGWSYTRYIVIIQKPDGTTAEQEIAAGETYGDALPTPPAPPTGKEFDHWETEGGREVNENTPVADTIDPATGNPKPLTPVYKPKTYTITFDFQVTGSRASTRKVEYGKGYGPLPTMTRTGYTLSGWYTAKTGGTQVTASTPIPAADQTLYARWTANSYTVSFDLNEGEGVAPASQSVSYQAKYTLPADPTRTNYTFTGWYTAKTGGTRVTADTKLTNAGDHTLYAQWSRKVYTVTFQSDGKTVETRRVNTGDALGALPAVTRTGYTLAGWGGVTADTVPTGSETYTAAWTANAYTVTLDPGGGTMGGATTQSVTYDAAYGTLPTPTRTGYAFTGWYTAQSGGSKVEGAATVKKAADHTLYARWTANTYTVTYNANGGSVAQSSKTVTFGQSYGALPAPTKAGSNFVGWQDESGKTVTAATVVTKAEHHTITAQWAERHEHKVAPNGTEEVYFAKELTQAMLTSELSQIKTLEGGNYYLTEDITTSLQLRFSGTVRICLNGHTLSHVDGQGNEFLYVNNNATLELCDCQGTGVVDAGSKRGIYTTSGTTTHLYGGTITAANNAVATYGVVTVDGARLVSTNQPVIDGQGGSNILIKSGSLESKSITQAVSIYTNNFRMEGGSILTNNGSYGIFVGNNKAVTISGGSIQAPKGCGINLFGGSVSLSGSPEIEGANGDIQFYGSNGKITVDPTLTGTYSVTCSAVAPTEAAPMTITTPAGADYSAHFVPVSGLTGVEVRNVGTGNNQTVELYKPHRHLPCGGSETCAHSGPAHDEAVKYQPIVTTGGDLNGGNYILTEDITLAKSITIYGDVSLCLNGHTLTATDTAVFHCSVGSSLTLCDCKGTGRIEATTGNAYVVAMDSGSVLYQYGGTIYADAHFAKSGIGTWHFYAGKLEKGSVAIEENPLYLWDSPEIDSAVNLYLENYYQSNKEQALIHVGPSLQQPPTPYRVAVMNGGGMSPSGRTFVPFTQGWPELEAAGKTSSKYFKVTGMLSNQMDKNDEGELTLRYTQVTMDGVVHHANAGGKLTEDELAAPEQRPGYLWEGWYTTRTGGTQVTKDTKFSRDSTIYPRWTECDHSGHDGSVDNIGVTCTTAQRRLFTCTKCGLEVDQTVGEPQGHNYSETWSKDGDGHWRVCDRCDAVEADSKAEHTYGEATVTEANCTQAGSRVKSCTVCGYTATEVIPALGHSFTAWDSDDTEHWHVCAREGCGAVETGEDGATVKTAHIWGDWQLTTAPQVGVAGEETAFCSDCGYSKTQPVAALPVPEYAVTYEKDAYTVGDAPSQGDTAEGGSFTLPAADCGLQRTGYDLAGWALLDEVGVPVTETTGEGDDAVTTEAVYTGSFTMPGRSVTFPVRWARKASYDLKPGETIILEDGTVIKNESGGVVTIDKNGDGQADTTITLPEGEDSVTVKVGTEEDADKIILPPGAKVETDPGDGGKGSVITIGDGQGAVDPNGKVDAPTGSTVEDPNGKKTTITGGQGGTIDPDGGVTFPEGEDGKVEVEKPDGTKTDVTVPGGGEGLDVTPGGEPVVNNPDETVTIVDPDGGSTTITVPEGGGITENEDGSYTVPGGSTIVKTDPEGNKTTVTIPEGEDTGEVKPDGTITAPGGSTVETEDLEGNKTQVTVPDGGGTVQPDGTVTKADQAKPVGIFDVIDIDADHLKGSITVTQDADKLEWRKVTEPQSDWADVAGDGAATATLDDLEAGDYEFRYKETDTHDPSPATRVQIRTQGVEARALRIAGGIEHGQVTKRRDVVNPGDTVNLTVKPEAGYELSSLAANYSNGTEEKVITPEIDPENTAHYTFTMPNADVTVTAVFTPIAYTIDYQWAGVEDGSFTVEDETVTLATPTQEGYTFSGWAYTKNGAAIANVTAAALMGRVKNGAVKLYPLWIEDLPVLEDFTVSFDAQGGAPTPPDQTVTQGRLALKPSPSPTKPGHNFGGWFTRADGGEPWQFNVYTVDKDVTLYAAWTAKNFEGTAVTPGDPIELPGGGTVSKDPDTGDVTITSPEGGVTTTITPPSGGEDVTVDPDSGEVNVPVGSTVDPGNGTKVELPDGGKIDPDGNITLPDGGGAVTIPDGEGGSTTITAPDGGGTLQPTGDGGIEVPGGSTVKTGDGPEVTIPEDGGKVESDGTIAVPGGSTVTIPDGEGGKTEITVPDGGEATITPTDDGKVEVPAGSAVKPEDGPEVTVGDQGGKVTGDGSVTVPGGGSVTIPDGEGGSTTITAPGTGGSVTPTGDGKVEVSGGSTVKSENGPEVTVGNQGGKVEGDGSVTVPGGSTVTIPDGEGGKTEITVPEDGESTVKPTEDGKVEVPGGSTVKSEGGPEITVPPDGGKVTGDGSVTVPGGSTVTIPDGEGGTIEITLPAVGESTLAPTGDGKLELPAGATVKKPDGSTITIPDGGGVIDPGEMIPDDDDDDDDDDDSGYVPGGNGSGGGKPAGPAPDKPGKEPEKPPVSTPPAVTVDRFVDVRADDWFYDSVKSIVEQGLMNGTDETHFSPRLDTSRAMIATVIWRMAGSPEPKAALSYPDCAPGSWYAKAVAWASERGVVKGYDNGSFGPNDPITREQLAAMLHRYAGSPASAGTLDGFADAEAAGAWAVDALCWAAEEGILTGKGGGILDPRGLASRAEVAAVFVRFSVLLRRGGYYPSV